MYGDLRFVASNLITSQSMLTLSSHAVGRVSGVKKTGSGVAIMTVTGNFTGEFDLSYEIEIDDVSGGVSVGEATFRWRTSDTPAGTWEESLVTTTTTPPIALNADGLNTGISVSFIGGVGADFAVGDTWIFECRATYGRERLLDRNRNTYWKSGSTTANIVIDYGTATQQTVSILQDHNLTAGATVKVEFNSSNSWASPAHSYTFTAITDPLCYYSDRTYRYARWSFVDDSNPDGYIRVSNIIHSLFISLLATNAVWGSQQVNGLKIQENESEAGIQRRYLYTTRQTLSLLMGEALENDDIDTLIEMQTALIDTASHRVLPLWVHLFSDEIDTLKLMDWQNIHEFARAFRSYLLNSGVTLNFSEVVKV